MGFGTAQCWLEGSDGAEFVAVTHPFAMEGSGAVLILSAKTGELVATLAPTTSMPHVTKLGKRVQALGDIDGDGAEEILIFGSIQVGLDAFRDCALAVSTLTGEVLYVEDDLKFTDIGLSSVVASSFGIDLDGDGIREFIAQPGSGDSALAIFDGRTGAQRISLLKSDAVSPESSPVYSFALPNGGDPKVIVLQDDDEDLRRIALVLDARGGDVLSRSRTTDVRRVFGGAVAFLDVDGDGMSEVLLSEHPSRPYVESERLSRKEKDTLGWVVAFSEDLQVAKFEWSSPRLGAWEGTSGYFPRSLCSVVGAGTGAVVAGDDGGSWAGEVLGFAASEDKIEWRSTLPGRAMRFGYSLSSTSKDLEGGNALLATCGSPSSGGSGQIVLLDSATGRSLWTACVKDYFH